MAKGSRAERLPLPADAGEAIAAYLADGRPEPFEGTRRVFLRARAPHRGLASAGVTAAVCHAGQRAGVGRVHAHRLRHSAAARMLAAGAPLTEIGQVLRHGHQAAQELLYRWLGAGEPLDEEELACLQTLMVLASKTGLLGS